MVKGILRDLRMYGEKWLNIFFLWA
jgi:hypothetical protein